MNSNVHSEAIKLANKVRLHTDTRQVAMRHEKQHSTTEKQVPACSRQQALGGKSEAVDTPGHRYYTYPRNVDGHTKELFATKIPFLHTQYNVTDMPHSSTASSSSPPSPSHIKGTQDLGNQHQEIQVEVTMKG